MKHLKQYQTIIILFVFAFLMISCNSTDGKTDNASDESKEAVPEMLPYTVGNPEGMLLAVREACGGLDRLQSLNDVEYDYHYEHPDGMKDISTERYIFENEISWAKYTTHEINVAPKLEGNIVHFYDGKTAKVYNDGKEVSDPEIIGVGQFLRQANYMWFNMMFKLNDPGILYKYEGQKEINGALYDIVNVTYDPAVTGKEQNDTFILYINPAKRMVESFDFSLPAFGIEQAVLNAQLTYEEIDGIQVITRREMTAPGPDGIGMVPMVDQRISNVKFDNGFSADQLSQEI